MKTSLLLMALLLAAGSGRAQSDHNQWTTYQGDNGHSGFVDLQVIAVDTEAAWVAQMPGLPTALDGLVVAGGIVVANNASYFDQQRLAAFAVVDGAMIWDKHFPGVQTVNQPGYHQGRVYVQTSNHESDTWLRVYDAATGAFVYQAAQAAQFARYLAPIFVNGRVISQSGFYGGLYSHNLSDGEQQWFVGLPQFDRWTPTPWGNALLCLTNRLDVLSAETGAPLRAPINVNWAWTGYTVNQAPVVIGDSAFLNNNGGSLVSVNLVAGEVAWSRSINSRGQVVAVGDSVYTIANQTLTSRAATNGDFRWAWVPADQPSEQLQSPFIITRRHAIVAGSQSTYILDLATRRELARIPYVGNLAMGEGKLVIAKQGVIRAFNVTATPLFADGMGD